jgi:hypothetical protein
MNKEEQTENLINEFTDFAAEYPQSALSLIIGLFVSLLEHSIKEQGGDENKAIKIDGGEKRDVTVHATKH